MTRGFEDVKLCMTNCILLRVGVKIESDVENLEEFGSN